MKTYRSFLPVLAALALLLTNGTSWGNGARGKLLVGTAEAKEGDVVLRLDIEFSGTQYETEKTADSYYLIQVNVKNSGKSAFSFADGDSALLTAEGKQTAGILDLKAANATAWSKLDDAQKAALKFPITIEPGTNTVLNIMVPDSTPLKDHPPATIALQLKALTKPIVLEVKMKSIAIPKK